VSVESWTERTPQRAADPAARLRLRSSAAETLLHLWRARWLMLLVLAPIVIAGVAFAFLAPTSYTASTRLLVRLGEEYVFDPIIGDAARGAFPQQEDVLQAESELARSPVIAERAITAIGLARLYPQLANARLRARGGEGYVIDQEALEAFARNLDVSTAPRSSILRMTFAHENPDLAAETLNSFVGEYLAYRQEVLSGGGAAGLSEQRAVIETRLQAADKALRDYLAANALSDFEAESASAAKLLSDIADEQARVEAALREAEARVSGLSRQIAATPREVDLYVESTSEQELVKLRLTREDLLARYLPDSRAVKDIDRRIAQLETFLTAAPAQGLRRIGPNPTWQALEADRAVQAATVSALTGRAAALAAQRQQAASRIARLATLEPDYLRLKRDRDALEASAGAFASREQSERARAELAARNVDNISVYEAARPPVRGDAGRGIILIAAIALGLLSALAVGLLQAWSVDRFATAGSITRTLGLPVLATTRER
jgi:uncharacterized protein involved in exopolysaccharide biosynthesis